MWIMGYNYFPIHWCSILSINMLGEVSGKQVSVCGCAISSDSREGACGMTCKFGCKHSTTNNLLSHNQKVTHAQAIPPVMPFQISCYSSGWSSGGFRSIHSSGVLGNPIHRWVSLGSQLMTACVRKDRRFWEMSHGLRKWWGNHQGFGAMYVWQVWQPTHREAPSWLGPLGCFTDWA